MKVLFLSAIATIATVLNFQPAVASGWSRSVTVTSITENYVNGEVIQITVSEIVDNSAHCANATGYAARLWKRQFYAKPLRSLVGAAEWPARELRSGDPSSNTAEWRRSLTPRGLGRRAPTSNRGISGQQRAPGLQHEHRSRPVQNYFGETGITGEYLRAIQQIDLDGARQLTAARIFTIRWNRQRCPS
jgi:hypothetical protein